MGIISALLLGCLFGSFPTAYFILKSYYNIDIREKGSGNVGAMNSFEVTQSKKMGILIFLIDFSKGAVPVLLVKAVIGNSFVLCGCAVCASVLAHCYSPWIGFRGGKGLATGAGGSFFLFPLVLAGWLIVWCVFQIIKKNIVVSNILTTLFMWIFSIIFVKLFFPFTFPKPAKEVEFQVFVSVMFLVILSKYFSPIWSVIKSNNQ